MKHESANLDLLRTIAVSLVVLSHIAVILGWDRQDVLAVGTFGQVGVAIFFVHTAYVLMQSLERHQEGALAFYVRRFLRIYPLSVAVVLLAALSVAVGGGHNDAGVVVSNLLLVQNITGHISVPEQLWTLPFEVQMYLVLPLLYALTRDRRPVLTIGAIWLASLVIAATGWFPLLGYVPCFMAGVFAFTLRHQARRLSPWVLFLVVLAGAVALSALTASGWRGVSLSWGVSAVVGLLVPFTREIAQGWLARCSALCARYSYSVYLTHVWAILAGFTLIDAPLPVQFIAFCVVVAMFVRVTYRWIELPGIELGKHVALRLRHESSAVGA